MEKKLEIGLQYEFTYKVPRNKTVPHIFTESDEYSQMPEVFSTGFLVAFLEWTCIQALNPYIKWPEEQTLGTHVNISHEAATPIGFEVTGKVELIEIEKRRLLFKVEAYDNLDLISQGTHERFIINREKFDKKIKEKIEEKNKK